MGLSAGTGKLCIFGHLGLVFIWSCFVSCLLLLLYYVICAPVLTEGTQKMGTCTRIVHGKIILQSTKHNTTLTYCFISIVFYYLLDRVFVLLCFIFIYHFLVL